MFILQMFHTDDFELQYLQKGYCPFCRSSCEDWVFQYSNYDTGNSDQIDQCFIRPPHYISSTFVENDSQKKKWSNSYLDNLWIIKFSVMPTERNYV